MLLSMRRPYPALRDLEETDYYICSVCGYTVEGAPPDDCPVCQAKAKAFFKAD